MAFRGRGRGSGGGGGYRFVKQEPFTLFPEIEGLSDARNVTEELALLVSGSKLQKFWNSAHYLELKEPEKFESGDIERFSDMHKQTVKRKRGLPDTILPIPEYFPAELVQGQKMVRRAQKKIRWNPDSGLQKLDLLEKLEQKLQGQEKGEKENKGDEDEEEKDENIEEEEEESTDEGDYDQNVDFDDDEDDYNMADDNNDEPTY